MSRYAAQAQPVLQAQGDELRLRYVIPSAQGSANAAWVASPLWFNQGATDQPLLQAANSSAGAIGKKMTADVVACNGTLVNAPIYLLALPTNTLPATTHANEAPFYPSTFSFVPVPVRAQDVTCLVGDKTVVASYKLLFDPLAPPVMGHGAKDLLPVAQEAPLSVPTPDAGTLSWNATQLGQEMAAALGPRSLAPNALDIMQNAGLLFGSALVLLYLLPKGLRDTFAARQRSGASGAEDNG